MMPNTSSGVGCGCAFQAEPQSTPALGAEPVEESSAAATLAEVDAELAALEAGAHGRGDAPEEAVEEAAAAGDVRRVVSRRSFYLEIKNTITFTATPVVISRAMGP